MKNKKFIDNLKEYAWKYIDECEDKRKEQLSNKGTIVEVSERKMPVLDYFLMYWFPKNCKHNKTISRSTYYRWLKWENNPKKKVIEEIDSLFKAIQLDIVANEGKGLAYIRHKFGWADKQQHDINANVKTYTANFGNPIQSTSEPTQDTQ